MLVNISEEEMKIRKFGKLRMKFPRSVLPWSKKKEIWVCDCGKEKLIRISLIISGHTKSCGRCNEISAEEMKIRKFGKLRMKDPKAILPWFTKDTLWVCDCGRELSTKANLVISGHTTSCGRCNEILEEEIDTRKFGKLRMKNPDTIISGSHKRMAWICNCGNETSPLLKDVIRNHTSSCGDCYNIIYDWY